ncbi:MAG: TIGR02186 family protein [Desulfobacterales bacterium]
MKEIRQISLMVAILLVVTAGGRGPAAASRNLTLAPPEIDIGAFFDGTQLTVSGEIPSACQAVVEVIGERVEEELMRKARRWEMWVNVGEIDIEGVPYLYYAMSSSPELLAPQSSDQPWGYPALRRAAEFKEGSRSVRTARLFDEFIKLKEDHKLYRILPGALNVFPGQQNGRSRIEGAFRFPARLPVGTCKVRLRAIRSRQVVEQQSTALQIQLVGLPAALFSLATDNALLYGFIALAIAVATGLLCGLVFSKGGKLPKGPEH